MCQEGMVAGVVIPYLTQSRWDFVGGIFFFAFCHIQRVGDIPVVRDTSVSAIFKLSLLNMKCMSYLSPR